MKQKPLFFSHFLFRLLLLIVVASSALSASGAPFRGKRIAGEVRDSITGEPLSFVNVFVKETGKTVISNAEGKFSLFVPNKGVSLHAYSVGYDDSYLRFLPSDTLLLLRLTPSTIDLQEVTVKPKKQKYSKKNNPAVEFMKKIRSSASLTDPKREPFYSYRSYDKVVLGLNNFTSDLSEGKIRGKFKFLQECIDTALWTGKPILDLSLKERISSHIFSSQPKAAKEVVEAVRSVGIDEVLDKSNVEKAVTDVMRNIDIYSPSITLLQNRFVSPLSPLGPDVYMYHLTDTVLIDNERCVELSFAPRNPETMGFNGKLYVPVDDSAMFVKRVTMRVPHAANLNYIRNLMVSQNYVRDSLGNRHKTLDDLSVELQLIPGTPEFYARRLTLYDSFTYHPDSIADEYLKKLGNLFVLDEAPYRSEQFFSEARMVPLSRAEVSVGDFMYSMRKMPVIYWGEKIVGILSRGYIKTGKKSCFDFGPLNSFVSYNDAEGLRLKVGGLTTANLFPHWFSRGYIAYGFKDHKWKYSVEFEHSFTEKKHHSREFPMHAIRALYRYDTDMLGQHYLFTSPDNIFLSLKRKGSNLVTYRRLSELSYILELRNNFSFQATLRHEIQNASPWVKFVNGYGTAFPRFTQAAMVLALRWAPGETFTQGYTNRAPINMDAPVFFLSHEYGPKGFLGADFCLNRTELSIQKRIWLSAFGYFDAIAKGGIIWSKVQYPALLWPNANLSYTIQPESYTLMNAMEFANDKYASLDVTYWGHGILFNRIPGLKKLKLREVINFSALWGGLSKKNNPAYDKSLFQFPTDAGSRVMTSKPYMEIGAGIDNILTILRVEYFWRLSYRDTPGCDKSGLRVALHFSF